MKYASPLCLFKGLVKNKKALIKEFEKPPQYLSSDLLNKYVNLNYPENASALAKRNLQLLSKKPPNFPRLFAINFADKFVSCSVSDSHTKQASFCKLYSNNVHGFAFDLESILPLYDVVGIVVGCPRIRKKDDPRVAQVKNFIDLVCKRKQFKEEFGGLKYTFWGKRYETKVLEWMSNFSEVPQYASKHIIDRYSAVAILQDYLDYVNKKTLDICEQEDPLSYAKRNSI